MAVEPRTAPKRPPAGNQLPAEPPTAPPAPTPVQAEAQRFVQANLKDFSGKLDMTHMPNTDVMTVPDGLKAAILQVADDNKAAVEAARGVQTDHQLTAMAEDLAVNRDVLEQRLAALSGSQTAQPPVVLAARMIQVKNAGDLFALGGKVADGTATSEEITQYYAQKQAFLSEYEQLAGVKAGSGRTQRALGLPVGLDPAVLDHVANVIRQNNPDLAAEAQAIRLAGTPRGIASILQGSLAYRALVKAPFQLLQRIYINGILSGPPTWFKIAFNNNVNLLLNQFDLFAGAGMRGLTRMAARIGRFPTADEGAEWSDAMAHLHGVISGGADALRVAGRVLRTGQSMDGIMRSEEATGRQTILGVLPEANNTWYGSIARGIDTFIGIPGRIIGSIDDFTKTLGYRGYLTKTVMTEVRQRLEAGTLRPGDVESFTQQLMQNPTEEMQQAAEDWAHRMTFQSPWPMDPVTGQPLAGARFQAWLNAVPAARFIFPFMRTATNIFKQTVERTPFAFFSARMRNAVMAGGAEGDIARARIATGTAIGSMLAWMAIHDRITGDAPKDPKARLAWEADGRRPYSIRVPNPFTGKDEWHEYMWFEPIATVAGIVADAVQLHSYVFDSDNTYSMMPADQRMGDATAHIMASIIQNTGNKTFMQGAAQFSEMYNDPTRAFTMWRDQMAAASVPYSGFVKFMRNEQDPYMRQAFTLMDKVRDELPTIPGVKGSKTLMPRLDLFGQPRKTSGGNAILGPLDPMQWSPSEKDDVTNELQKLMEQTRTVPLTLPSKQLAIGGNASGLQDGMGMRLTPQEYYEYVRNARATPIFNGGTQTFRERLSQLIASPVYQEATPPERANMFTRIQHEADRAGRKMLWDNNESFRERMMAWQAEKNRLKFNQ
ncbi:MAG TPA: hypothetical protein VGU20_31025 [Stellaceae bacterium]|nr:hypothetical protein [Terriglobia bacterium]HEV2551784.1 hypothetical protein [Stellaceae bacterium]